MAKKRTYNAELGLDDIPIDESRIKVDLSNLSEYSRRVLMDTLDRCIRCNTCKYAFEQFTPSCPAGEKFQWESYWASGKIRIARALLTGELSLDDEDIIDPIFACPTCGSCTDNCQAPHNERIVDIIEALREYVAKNSKIPPNQAKMSTLIKKFHNPYGIENSTNEDLKKQFNLPDKAEVVYFIGCTSNYRQQQLRDATLEVFKKLDVNFTLVDEYCCGSPIIRTGQLEEVTPIVNHNIEQFQNAGAKTIVTSCAGCYRTLKKDFSKFTNGFDLEVLHTTEFLLADRFGNISQKKLKDIPELSNKILTYHDPCHLGHHMGLFEPPRELLMSLPNVEFREMPRNRKTAWCCGAGGGVKIGYPDWAIEISDDRIEEAKETGAEILVSTCPFCKTNLSDGNKHSGAGLDVVDLIELLNKAL